MIDPSWIAGLGAFLFCIGLVGVFTRKNAIIVLMCVEIMLNAANLNFVAGAMSHGDLDGWIYAAIAIAIAAAEVFLEANIKNPKTIVEKSLNIASEICIYTNNEINVLEIK